MTDGSEAREGDDSLGMEISEPLDMRSCPGYTNQELSSLPSHILLPKDAAGRQLVPREGAWPKRMAQISAQLLVHPDPKYTAFPPNEDLLMEREIRTCIPPPSPPPRHMIPSAAALQWDFLVVRWPPWVTSSLRDSNWLRTQDILNQLPTWQLHREFASSSTDQTWTRGRGYSLAGSGISWAGGALGV